jgi:hypothetical protein
MTMPLIHRGNFVIYWGNQTGLALRRAAKLYEFSWDCSWANCGQGTCFYRRERFLSTLNFLRRAGRKLVQYIDIGFTHAKTETLNYYWHIKIFLYFYGGATAAGVTLNDEKFGMLCGNHIRRPIRSRTGVSRFQEITYGLWAKGCYTGTRKGKESYMETIYA